MTYQQGCTCKAWRLLFAFGFVLPFGEVVAEQRVSVPEGQWQAAQMCTEIPRRLERLSCFDEAFETPLSVQRAADNESGLQIQSESGLRALESERKRRQRQGFILNQDSRGLWLTALPRSAEADYINGEVATSPDAQRTPILMLSCIDEISRVELVMPAPIERPRVSVSIGGQGATTQGWMTDDSSLVLRTGRGIPAINTMKAMLRASPLVLRSNIVEVDNLTFDAKGLADAVKPLRKMCRW